ncbi:MAG: fucose isomerase [Spirochaetia bacterium]|nr:fucose isomerase [Spirochaetia bacterium]
MKQHIRLGAVCLSRTTFDFNAAKELWADIRSQLAALPNVTLTAPENLVFEVDEAKAAASELARAEVDGVMIISGTFHLGHLALEIAKSVKAPILLWGLPELPYNGGKIRLNSVCGVNLNASNLYKAGIRNFRAVVRSDVDTDWVDALRALAVLKNSHIGIIGYRAHGFFNLSFADLSLYRETGILLDHYELSDMWNFPITDEEAAERKKDYLKVFDCSGISEAQLDKVARLAVKMKKFLDKNKLDALAIRCWPEFAAEYGISPCAAMSLLQSEDRILACEGDVEGAISMLMHRAVGAETPFLFDFSQVDFEKNHALFWHCGVAPCNLWDGKCNRSLDTYFAGGKGVTADFVLKSGEVSVLRLDSADGKYRVFIQKATAVPMEKELKGTYLKAVFDSPVQEVLAKVVNNGIAHHASVVYGTYLEPFRIAAKIAGWEVIE